MSEGTIAERYARALFELGTEQNQLAPLTRELSAFSTAYAASSELRSILENPLVEESSREAVLRELGSRVGAQEITLNAVRLLSQRRRLRYLPAIARRLAALMDEKAGILRATVTSASDLPESYFANLLRELEAATQKKVILERKQDPSLIAGVVTRIGDNTIDGSLKGKLEQLERQLMQAT